LKKYRNARKFKEFLDEVCKKYFETHAPDWRYYAGWKFSDNYYPNCIVIHYGYYDWRDQYESGDEVIPMDVLIEFSKKL
jgi:hypothetical protein